MSPAELKALEDYINDALAKGWIRESKSPVGVPVLFIPRRVVNYAFMSTTEA